jgi:formamidopyrimidine-DNA glycosylase
MPELPEVETVCRGLARKLPGLTIRAVAQRRANLRIPFPRRFAARLEGQRVARIARRAKYILIVLDGGLVLIVHLGMSGRLVISTGGSPAGPHDHVVVDFDDGTSMTYHDARRFGLMTLAREDQIDSHRLLRRLGPEPLGNAFSGPALAVLLRDRRVAIKSALLDQTVVAGIGNIYACEALFRAGISPRRLARSVTGLRAERLASAIRTVLDEAIRAGGSTLRDYVQTSGELGYFQHAFAVYDREGQPCPGCDCTHGVRRIVQGGRSTFLCARRQR